jgi:Undecaprenyl-phosphate galactose phosphotransferase WbaP
MSSMRVLATGVGGFSAGASRRRSEGKIRPNRRHIPPGVLLALLDVLVIEIAVVLAAAIVSKFGGTGWSLHAWGPALAIAAAATLLLANVQLGLYDIVGQASLRRFRLRVQGTMLMPWPALAMVTIVGGEAYPAASMLTFTCILLLPIGLLAQNVARKALLRIGAWGETAVVVGPSEAAGQLAEHFLDHPELGLRPIGRIGDEPEDRDTLSEPRPLPHLGTVSELDHFTGNAAVAIVLTSNTVSRLEPAQLPFRRVIVVPNVTGPTSLWGSPSGLGEALGFTFFNRSDRTLDYRIKRLLDIGIAAVALIITLPLIGVLAGLVKLVSPGPALYTQERVGLRRAPVAIVKLRTMHLDSERRLQDLLARDQAASNEWNRYMKLSGDPRVLPGIGNFLRRTSLDELPQLWNVIRGDISLVGPRPFPAYHVNRFDPAFQTLRARVKPGLTGLWQVTERSNADLQRQEAIDTFYIRNWSLWLDLYILVRTLPALLSTRGAR